MITIDAMHTVRDTARTVINTHKADYLMTVKGNAPEIHETLACIDWGKDATDTFKENVEKVHGRIEQRRIRTLTPPRGVVNHPRVAQLFRIERLRINVKSGVQSIETAYGTTSVPLDRGFPERLLAWNRGH
ncbi:MAG: hypothetical protein J4F49_11405 [Rhodobacteraceae bacterium]|nr:hypothetical protein [Paracoccaceae bacterium]